jgi:hypothetical protein
MVSCLRTPSVWVIFAVVAMAVRWTELFVKASPRSDRYRRALAQSRQDNHHHHETHNHSHEHPHVHHDHSHGDFPNHHQHHDVDNQEREEHRHSQDHSHYSDSHDHYHHDVDKENEEEEEERKLRNGSGHRTKQNLSCGTRTPEKSLILEQLAVRDAWIQNQKIKSQDGRTLQDDDEPTLIVPTCIHVIRPTNDPDPTFLNFNGIQRQLDHLNSGYSSSSCCDSRQDWCSGACSVESGVQFQMALLDDNGLYNSELGTTLDVTTTTTTTGNVCTTRTENDDWYSAFLSSNEEVAMIDTLYFYQQLAGRFAGSCPVSYGLCQIGFYRCSGHFGYSRGRWCRYQLWGRGKYVLISTLLFLQTAGQKRLCLLLDTFLFFCLLHAWCCTMLLGRLRL